MTTNVNARAVLLLNHSREPLGIITIRKAVDLMMRGVAYGVHDVKEVWAAKLRTPGDVFKVPSVLCLKYYVNVPHRTITWSRRKVLKRDDYTCIFCGVSSGEVRNGKVLNHGDFTVDHLIPVSQGGGNTWGNTACACYRCNHRKRDRTPNQAGMKLRWEPKRPRTNYYIITGEIPTEWKIYIEV